MEDFLHVVTVLILPSAAAIFTAYISLPKVLEKLLDHYSQRSLERYKQELNIHTEAAKEAAKFDYQRMLQDFSLYTTKKHSSYIELYEDLLQAHSRVLGMRGFNQLPAFTDCNEEDISDYLSELKIPKGTMQKLIETWRVSQSEGISEIYKVIRFTEERGAGAAHTRLKNKFWQAQLYLSDDVQNELQTLINNLGSLYVDYQEEYRDLFRGEEGKKHSAEVRALRDNVEGQFSRVITLMKRELSTGYYRPNSDLQ